MSSYEANALKKRKRFVQTATYISIIGFAGSTLFTLGQTFWSANQSSTHDAHSEEASHETSLTSHERSYELILEREPNNRIALEGLASTRIQLGNFEGAIAPLEALVELYPDDTNYRTSLEQAKEGRQSNPG